jgi:hypothetical protein
MKIKTFPFIFGLILLCGHATADTELNGFIKSDNRLLVSEDELTFVDIYNTLRLKVNAKVTEKVSAESSLDLRYHDFSRLESPAELGEREKINPLDFGVWEAYVDLFDFPLENLDWRIGKQRIAWGTADTLNPTDNLNPDDFSDPLDFGRKLPTTAFNATYYLGDYTLTGIWQPALRPVLLPQTGFTFAQEMPSLPLPPTMIIAEREEHLLLPEPLLKNSMFAAKLKSTLLNVDWSLSYFRGFDDIPILKSITATPIDATSLNITSFLSFPKLNVIGADLAGEFFSIGFWGEGAIFLPDEESVLLITAPGPLGTPQTEKQTILKDEAYFKYTVGLDYTFKGGIYINAQYMRGFFHERGRESLQDYIIARVEKDFFDEELKVALSGGLEIKEFDEIKNNIGHIVAPELTLKPADSVEITLGTFLLGGKEGTLFGQWKDQDQAYLKVTVDF